MKDIASTKPNRKRNLKRYSLIGGAILLFIILEFMLQSNQSNSMEVIVGSQIPSFELKDQNGKMFQIDSVVGKKNLVVYFYPKDDTPGCTKEACAFRDQFDVFTAADAIVIGISAQSPESHLAFAKKHRLNFTLLSDEDNKVRKLFKVKGNLLGLIPGRVTYIVNKEGKVVYIFNSQFEAEKHVDEALRILKTMK